MVDLRMYICNVWWNSALSVNARRLRSRLLKGKPRPKPRVGEFIRDCLHFITLSAWSSTR